MSERDRVQVKPDIGNPRTRTRSSQPLSELVQNTPEPTNTSKPRSTQFSLKRWWPIALLVICVLVIGTLAYGYITTKRQLAGLAGNGKTAAQNETTQLVAQIGEHIELPADTPTIATVKDVSKLQTQEFFKNAQNGDKVLVYTKAGRAVLYRPSTSKVIEYSRVNLNTAPAP
jgi:hypothetical protein